MLRMAISTLGDLLHHRAIHQPNVPVYTFLEDGETIAHRLTYLQLERCAQTIAVRLQERVAFGSRVILVYPPGLEFITTFFGCLLAGMVAVPAYLSHSKQAISQLRAIATDAQVSLILTTTSQFTQIEPQLAQHPDLAVLPWLTTHDLSSDPELERVDSNLRPETLAFIQYTSGSTSSPKGVMISHQNLLHNLAQIDQGFGHTPHSKGVIWLPSYHDMGLVGGILQPLYGGFPVVLIPPVAFLQKPFRWLQAISEHRATTSGGPNFAYELCVRKVTPEQKATLDLSSWEAAFNGAEFVRAETLERFATTFEPCGFRREAFYPCYGMAEATLFITGGQKMALPKICQIKRSALACHQVVPAADEADRQAIVSGGQPWLGQNVIIVEPNSLTRCSVNQVGEIWVAGESIAQGYWNQPERTQYTFRAYLADTGEGPFLRTGDLGFLRDGELFVTGRIKDLILIRGRNYYPQDIERTVQQSHSALRPDCGAAFAVEIENEERLVIAHEVERSYLRALDVDEIIRTIRQAVAEQQEIQPYAVVLLRTASIPKTSSGKVQYHACRTGFLCGSLEVVGEWIEESQGAVEQPQLLLESAPTAETIQAWLIARLAPYLNVSPDDIDIDEPFADYSLDSSVAVTLTGELADWLNCDLSPTLFWKYPNISTLAQHLAQEYQLAPSEPQPFSL